MSDKTNFTVNRRNAWIRLLETVADQMEDSGELVLPAHLDSVVAELEFQNSQDLVVGGLVEKRA